MNKAKITLEQIMTHQNFFDALKDCNKEVNYKYSVQQYNSRCAEKINESIHLIMSGGIPEVKDKELVKIRERGKERIICPIDISDRVIQKVICEKVLIPSIFPHLIYDNGASVKYKGTEFSRRRVNIFLEKVKKKSNPNDIYVLIYDIKNFFGSIPHSLCYYILDKYLYDKRLVDLTIGIIESYKLKDINEIENETERNEALRKLENLEDTGICLGSQISQIMAVAVLNDFDHYIKDVLRVKCYQRHMDDGIIVMEGKKNLKRIKTLLEKKIQELGLRFNEKKTHIIKASRGFTYLKVKYRITSAKKTIKNLVHSGIIRERKKLKKFQAKIKLGKMSLDDVYMNIQSWIAHSKIAKCQTTVKKMIELYNELYGGYRLTYKYYSDNPNILRKKKVIRA